MNDDDFTRRLAAQDLTTPGITLDEAVRRAATRAHSRRPSLTLRLAVTAAVVWLAVLAVQALVERNMNAVVPPGQNLVAHGATPSLLIEEKLLLAELTGDGAWLPDKAESSPAETCPAVPDAADPPKTSSLPVRRWSHV